MKIFGDWVIKNEEQRIEASLRSLLPHIDKALVVDTGSTDDTLDIVHSVKEDFPYLDVITGVDIGPNKEMAIARNVGLRNCPPEYWLNETTWYMETAGDEVYDHTISNLRATMAAIEDNIIWVYTWGRDWHINEDTQEPYILNPKFGRPRLYRHIDGMLWRGIWNRERIVYPIQGSYFQYERVDDRTKLYKDADIWYDHYGWADSKRVERLAEYVRLDRLVKLGEIPHPE